MDEWKESAAPLNPEQPELGGAETEEQPKPKLRSGAQVRLCLPGRKKGARLASGRLTGVKICIPDE